MNVVLPGISSVSDLTATFNSTDSLDTNFKNTIKSPKPKKHVSFSEFLDVIPSPPSPLFSNFSMYSSDSTHACNSQHSTAAVDPCIVSENVSAVSSPSSLLSYSSLAKTELKSAKKETLRKKHQTQSLKTHPIPFTAQWVVKCLQEDKLEDALTVL